MTAETRYLLAMARAWAATQPGPVPAPAGLDGQRFTRLLGNQPAMQTLVPWLDPTVLPDRERRQLDQATEVSRRRTTVMLLELERILPALTERGCRPVVLKGGSLALTVYDRPEDRWFLDLDLLIRPEKLQDAYDALCGLGYRFAATPRSARYYEDHHFHRILVSNQGVYIEVHWAITLSRSIYTYDLAALRRCCLEIPLGHAEFLAPAHVDQILHGVLQSLAGGFGDLRRILDLHLLDAHLDDTARELMCARARTSNLTTGLWLQYRLREQLLAAPLPRTVDLACRPSPRLVRLFDQLQVARNCLSQDAARIEGYDYLLHCLCAPSELRPREMRRYVFPDAGGLLEAGLGQEGSITLWSRLRLHLSRLRASARLCGLVARASLQRT
jgi:hypothetical protein